MLRFLSQRLHGQYKEGGLIVGKFLVSNSGATLTPVDDDSYQLLTASGDTGVYTVTLSGGAKKITVVGKPYQTAGSEANRRVVDVTSVTAGTGAIVLQVVNPATEAVAPAIADLVDGETLVVCLYVDK